MNLPSTLTFDAPAAALVRAVPDRFTDSIQEHPADIDVDRARLQHAAYVSALKEVGVAVRVLPALPDHPDCCFVEDPAVILGRRALLTRSAAPGRRGESAGVSEALADWCALSAMPTPATLDGGDVLRIGQTLYVGRTQRSNSEGLAWLKLAATAEGLTVRSVPLRAGLHLKSAVTLATPELLIYCPSMLRPESLAEAGVELLPTEEPHGGNVLALGDTILVSAAAPRTAEALHRRGLRVRVLQVDEFHKADGALTCLSLRLPRAGTWTA
ncbi:MAG: dimethylargininase [Myxococcota bacterium]|jgi:dimethylargininase